ncbi:DUF2528 family protein [Aquimarina sp. W85]|uniref:DUF2528 family protein n=1 Tax=Aquimarina rhodophyticola TaxID=3342246 RepID=UPI00366D96B8
MKITYEYDYNSLEASAVIEIDTDKLSKKDAKSLLEFFFWNWNKENDIYEELAKKYAWVAIRFATHNEHNLLGVKEDFEEAEGFPPVDGTYGITLLEVEGLHIDEYLLERVHNQLI